MDNISRSGRVRKKSSKLADFESPDDIDIANKRAKNEADDTDVDDIEADLNLTEEEWDAIPDITDNGLDKNDATENDEDEDDVKYDDGDEDDEDEGKLMIMERPNKKPKAKKVGIGKIRRDKGVPRISAFMLWAKNVKPGLVAANPALADFSALKQKLADMWTELSANEKSMWKRKSARFSKMTKMPQSVRLMAPNSTSVSSSILQATSTTSVGTMPIDAAAHLKLLGESLAVIGHRLTEHNGQIAVSGSLSVLLDSLLCAMGPLTCLTQQVPELNVVASEKLAKILDNIAYIMPGL